MHLYRVNSKTLLGEAFRPISLIFEKTTLVIVEYSNLKTHSVASALPSINDAGHRKNGITIKPHML